MILGRSRGAALSAAWSALLAALVLAGARPASASDALPASGHILAPAAGERLAAGSTAIVRWSDLPAEVEEFELLLSLDGGHSYGVRLTPRLDPATRELSWVVPNLPADDARLRLRVGIGGSEIESAASAPFRILGCQRAPAATLRFAAGEWWTAALAAPPPSELPSREQRADLPGPTRSVDALALLPNETHPFDVTPAASPAAHPVGATGRPVPAAWSNPSRPVAPPQRE